MDQSPTHPTIEASARRRAAELGCTFERIVSFDELPE